MRNKKIIEECMSVVGRRKAIQKALTLQQQELICSTCGFPRNIKRNHVFLKKSIVELMYYEENKCKECGHQKDGTTISVVQDAIRRIVSNVKKRQEQEFKKTEDEEIIKRAKKSADRLRKAFSFNEQEGEDGKRTVKE